MYPLSISLSVVFDDFCCLPKAEQLIYEYSEDLRGLIGFVETKFNTLPYGIQANDTDRLLYLFSPPALRRIILDYFAGRESLTLSDLYPDEEIERKDRALVQAIRERLFRRAKSQALRVQFDRPCDPRWRFI
jgi:hypothetical protein